MFGEAHLIMNFQAFNSYVFQCKQTRPSCIFRCLAFHNNNFKFNTATLGLQNGRFWLPWSNFKVGFLFIFVCSVPCGCFLLHPWEIFCMPGNKVIVFQVHSWSEEIRLVSELLKMISDRYWFLMIHRKRGGYQTSFHLVLHLHCIASADLKPR